MSEEAEADIEHSTEETSMTTNSERRHHLTNDAIAALLVVTYSTAILADALGLIALEVVPDSVLLAWIVMAGTAVAWAFGPKAIEAWRGD